MTPTPLMTLEPAPRDAPKVFVCPVGHRAPWTGACPPPANIACKQCAKDAEKERKQA